MYLSYFGIRVTDLRRSAEFYAGLFGQAPVEPPNWSEWKPTELGCVLFRDPVSGQRLELNYYPPGNPYAVPYRPGEELDHIAFCVDDLDATLARLKGLGFVPEKMAHYDGPIKESPGFRMAYLRDPDGIQLELYQTGKGAPTPYDPSRY